MRTLLAAASLHPRFPAPLLMVEVSSSLSPARVVVCQPTQTALCRLEGQMATDTNRSVGAFSDGLSDRKKMTHVANEICPRRGSQHHA